MKLAALALLAVGAAAVVWYVKAARRLTAADPDEWTFPVDPWPPMDHAPTCPAGGTGGWKYACRCGFGRLPWDGEMHAAEVLALPPDEFQRWMRGKGLRTVSDLQDGVDYLAEFRRERLPWERVG